MADYQVYSTARHSLGLYFGVSVACRYAVPHSLCKMDALRPAVERAVAQVVFEQPYMRVGIIDEDTSHPAYVHVPSIDLSRHIRWLDPLDAQDIDGAMESELTAQLSSRWENLDRQPPWKVTVFTIRESNQDDDGDINGPDSTAAAIEILYTYHHALGDGTSGTIFHKQLLRALTSPVSSLSSPSCSGVILTLPEPADLPPTQEELVPFRLSWSYFLKAVWRGYGPSWLQSQPDPPPWTGLTPTQVSRPYAMNLRLFSIPADTAATLVPLARAHDSTITGLFHALVATSLVRRLPASEARSFLFGSAVSLRRCIDRRKSKESSFHPETQFAVLVSSIAHSLPLEMMAQLRNAVGMGPGAGGGDANEAMWNVARAVTAGLRERVATLPWDDPAGLLKYIADMRGFIREVDGKPRPWTWQVSNVGAMPSCPPITAGGQQDGPHGDGAEGDEAEETVDQWRITRAVFSQSALKSSTALMLNLIGLVGGELTGTLSWQDGVVDDEVMEGMMSDLQAFSRSLGNDETLKLVGLLDQYSSLTT
ncbi:hypothetical protein ACRALDRAFT_1069105 [Sodiomyces alcalophilus JCM 7366]|uniref:uncharacterized protein n=1 Tax=Sodiomyces alcalophilus JCM 7366 TaxID=591952 RepID=UPI0039B471E5